MYSLDTIILYGNPLINQHPYLAKIENNSDEVTSSLNKYFGGNTGGLSAIKQGSVGSGFQ